MSTAILDQARIETATEVLRGGIELIDSLAEEWRALSDENPRQPFCRPEWIRAYYRCFAPKATLLVVTVRSSGRLTAVLPLIEEHALFYGLPAQKLSGAVNIHSYRFDAACRGGAEGESAIACIWQALKDLEDWDLIEFAQMPEDGALASLMARAQSEGYPTGRRDGQRIALEARASSRWRSSTGSTSRRTGCCARAGIFATPSEPPRASSPSFASGALPPPPPRTCGPSSTWSAQAGRAPKAPPSIAATLHATSIARSQTRRDASAISRCTSWRPTENRSRHSSASPTAPGTLR